MQAFWEWLATLDWGDVPSWVGGIGTTAAVIVALWQSGRETRKRRHEEERAQAGLVAAWIVPRPYEIEAGLVSGELIVDLQNCSSTPVYTVVVTLVPIKGSAPRNSEGMDSAVRLSKLLMVLPPRRFWTEFSRPSMAMGMEYGVELAFRDAAGESWVRRGNGALESLGGADPREGRLCDFSAKSDEFFEDSRR